MVRRVLVALILVFLGSFPYMQVMLMIILNMLNIVFVIQVRPFETKFKNTLEILNEVCILVATYVILLFSDFVNDFDNRYNIGWFLTGFVALNIAANMIVMIVVTAVSLKDSAKTLIAKCKMRRSMRRRIMRVVKPIPQMTTMAKNDLMGARETKETPAKDGKSFVINESGDNSLATIFRARVKPRNLF